MAYRNILTKEQEILRKKSRRVEVFDDKLATLIDDMYQTLEQAEGAGLAAPQVGVLRRVVVINVGDGPMELVNPEILWTEGEDDGLEGCLSFPGQWGFVVRPHKLRVRFQDRTGAVHEEEGEDLFARCVCHELDHLDGVLYVDKAEKMLTQEELEELVAEKQAEYETEQEQAH